jgi:hypothetical protein
MPITVYRNMVDAKDVPMGAFPGLEPGDFNRMSKTDVAGYGVSIGQLTSLLLKANDE